MNINRALDKTWESKSLREILDAPVAALEGVSESDAAKLQEAFDRMDTNKDGTVTRAEFDAAKPMRRGNGPHSRKP